MTGTLYRFPHTPHLAWLGAGAPRDDKVLSRTEAGALLAEPVVVEEKVDGANLGLSPAQDGTLRVQNRGTYLQAPFRGQFSRLPGWLAQHEHALLGALRGNLIAFGEWCAARHSLHYEHLPDWWLLFDIYDRNEGRFWSTGRRDRWARAAGIAVVPELLTGRVGIGMLRQLATGPSRYRHGALEGIVVRSEGAQWLDARAKLVNPQFTQTLLEHWRSRPIEWNQLDPATEDRSEKAAKRQMPL